MKYIVMAALLVALLAAGVVAQDEPLSREEQIKIITGYMYMRGQLDDMPEHMVAATSEPHDHDHGHDHDSRGAIIKCGTPAILAFQLNKHRLDKELMQELGVELWDRPTDKVDTFRDSDSGWFRIHYTTAGEDAVYRANVDNNANGHPDYVDTVAMVMDSVRIFLIDSLGYPLPPSDGFYAAGDGPLYDVYLYDIGPSFYGLAYTDSVRIDGSLHATSFLELDNDYQQLPGYTNRPLDAVRVTAAHEYFHSIQFGMDVTEFEFYSTEGAPEKRYWMEMSAVWAEEIVYDDINDYYYYLPAYYNYPRVSIQQQESYASDIHPYAAGIFPIYMTEKYDRGVVRKIWELCEVGGEGPDFFTACDSVLKEYSGRIDTLVTIDHFREFSLWNYFTGERRDLAPSDTIGFSEGAFYPEIPDEAIAVFDDPPDTVTHSPEHWATAYARWDNVWAMVWDSTWYVCYDAECDSVIELSEGLDPGFDTVLVVDSVFDVGLSFSRFYLHPWGVNAIYHLRDQDSTEVDYFLLPANFDGSQQYRISVPDPQRYQSIAISVSVASTNRGEYNPRRPSNFINTIWFTEDSLNTALLPDIIVDPTAGYASRVVPYPNPFVVSEMGSDPMQISVRLKTGLDSLDVLDAGAAFLEVDVYTAAGEYVWGNRLTAPGEVRSREVEYSLDWPLVNLSGGEVASGVYVILCRLYEDATRANELVSETGKVVIVR